MIRESVDGEGWTGGGWTGGSSRGWRVDLWIQ